MLKIDLQLFGGRGSGSSMSGGVTGSAGGYISQTSTGGKLTRPSPDQWYGENDNGSYAVINDAGSSDYNLYKYGNRRIYEVDRGVSDEVRSLKVPDPERLYAFTQKEAINLAKGWLKANKNI